MHTFSAKIEKIGVNPYVLVPENILDALFTKAQKHTSPIPIYGVINNIPYTQTLVRYAGDWRLYINTKMLKDSPKHVGETISLTVDYDHRPRKLPIHPKLKAAFRKDRVAQKVFNDLPSYKQHEINRYICGLKSETSINHNIQRAIDYLHGKTVLQGVN